MSKYLSPIVLVFTVLLVLGACTTSSDGGSAGPTTASANSGDEGTDTVDDTDASEQVEQAAKPTQLVLAIESGEATIDLEPVESGSLHPLLSWSELTDASIYGVYLYTPSGEPYWFWRGTASAVFVGGSVQLNDDALGVAAVDGMTWGVVAYDQDDKVVGVSELATIEG